MAPNSAQSPGVTRLAGVIAVVGCDGSGKTTLVHDLVARLGLQRPTQRRYMGLVSGEAGDRIKQLPFVGVALERYLAAKARRAQDMRKKLPGTFTSIVMYLLSWYRLVQLWRMKRLAASGVLVIADRYPQCEVPGFHYDGPGLSADRTTNGFVRRLARAEQRLYERMARLQPGLVIRLLVDPEVAHNRKPDHPLHELRDKIEIMPRIGYNGSEICEIDAGAPYSAVLTQALQAIEGHCRKDAVPYAQPMVGAERLSSQAKSG